MSTSKNTVLYTERLLPTPWLFIMLLLMVPAIMLLFMPLNLTLGLALAPLLYLLAALFFVLTSPVVTVTKTDFVAGRASIPVRFLGQSELLHSDALTLAIGIQADARAYLLLRPGVRKAVRIANTDPTDPAPYWIVVSRNPEQLQRAIEAAKAAI